MGTVMKNLQIHIPKKSLRITYHLTEGDFVCSNECYHRILSGGDQLTVPHCHGAQSNCYHNDQSGESIWMGWLLIKNAGGGGVQTHTIHICIHKHTHADLIHCT